MDLFIRIMLILFGGVTAWLASMVHAANQPESAQPAAWVPYAAGLVGGGLIAVLLLGLGTWWGWLLALLALGMFYILAKDELAKYYAKPSTIEILPDSAPKYPSPAPNRPAQSIPVSSIRLNGAMDDLRAMCRDMASDGVMDEEEVRQLSAYLDDHFWLATDGLVKLMGDHIRDVLADGEVTEMEGMDVLDLAAAVADGKTLDDMKSWEALAPLLENEPPKVKRRSKIKNSKRKEGRKLDTIRFIYRGAIGDASERRVVVHVLDEEYFSGFCLDSKAGRTFRLDRVISNITSEETSEIVPVTEWAAGLGHGRSSSPSAPVVPGRTVLFTGFKRSDRDRLEAIAQAHGWQVKTSVSPQLSVLCTGPIEAPGKVAKAKEHGVSYLLKQAGWRRCKGLRHKHAGTQANTRAL